MDDYNLLHCWTGDLWISCCLGAPTWMVATHNLPDEIKYFVQLVCDVFMINLLWEHRKGTCTKLKILIQCRVHVQASVVPPTFLAISLFNCATLHMNILWTANIQMKWRCDHRSGGCDSSNCKLSPKNVFGLQWVSSKWPLCYHCSAPPTELWWPIRWEQANLLNSSYPWKEWNMWMLSELQTYKWNEDVIIAVVIAI